MHSSLRQNLSINESKWSVVVAWPGLISSIFIWISGRHNLSKCVGDTRLGLVITMIYHQMLGRVQVQISDIWRPRLWWMVYLAAGR